MCSERSGAVQYKTVPGHPDYRAGRDGSVWVRRPLHGRWKEGESYPWRKLKTRYHNRSVLVEIDGQRQALSRLILKVFVGPCPKGCCALHVNGDRLDHRLHNLRWDEPVGINREPRYDETEIARRSAQERQRALMRKRG